MYLTLIIYIFIIMQIFVYVLCIKLYKFESIPLSLRYRVLPLKKEEIYICDFIHCITVLISVLISSFFILMIVNHLFFISFSL